MYFAGSRIFIISYHKEHQKTLIYTRSNLLSQPKPHTEINIFPIITPFFDIGKSFIATIHKNWHTIANDATLSAIMLSKH